jgi:hypothetical protein
MPLASTLPNIFAIRLAASLLENCLPPVGLASEKAAFTVVLTKCQYCLSNPVVPIWLQQELHHVLERRPDDPLDFDDLIRLMSKGAQRRQAACQNAGLRINQGAVEMEKNRARRGHGSRIVTAAKRVNARLNRSPPCLTGADFVAKVFLGDERKSR